MSDPSTRAFSIEELKKYNNFYNRSDARQIIYSLYRGVCPITNEAISLEDAHVCHTVPRSHGHFFETLYPGLDVNNIVNLSLGHKRLNISASDYHVVAPEAIHNSVSRACRLIRERLPKILRKHSVELCQQEIEDFINNIGRLCVYDITPVYDYAVCRELYHALPAEMLGAHLLNEHLNFFPKYDEKKEYFYHGSVCLNYITYTVHSAESKRGRPFGSNGGSFFYDISPPRDKLGDKEYDPLWVQKARQELDDPLNRDKILPLGEWIIFPRSAVESPKKIEKRYYSRKEKELKSVLHDIRIANHFLTYSSLNETLVYVPETCRHHNFAWTGEGIFSSHLKHPEYAVVERRQAFNCKKIEEKIDSRKLRNFEGLVFLKSSLNSLLNVCEKYKYNYVLFSTGGQPSPSES